MLRAGYLFALFLISLSSYSWNTLGHQLVAQIAYDNLTQQSKTLVDKYSHSYQSKKTPSSSKFVSSASWLDYIRIKGIHWYDSFHYIDIPFSEDGTTLPPVQGVNAQWAIKQALSVLASNRTTSAEKGLSLRILIHTVGDIHQPLHTVTQISSRFPAGDLGGNLFKLGKNPIGKNLHQYWDNGAGILVGQSKQLEVKNKALQLEKKWTCDLANQLKKPKQWVKASHEIALSQAYQIKRGSYPGKQYQLIAQNIVEKQIVFAGCRLALLINNLA